MRRPARRLYFLALVALFGISSPAAADWRNNARERPPTSGEIFAQAQNYLYNSAYNEAEILFRRYMELEPQDPIGNLGLARVYYFRWRFEQKKDAPDLRATEAGRKKYAEFAVFVDDGVRKTAARIEDVKNGRINPHTFPQVGVGIKIENGKGVGFYLFVAAYLKSLRGALQVNNESYSAAMDTAREMAMLARASDYQDAKFLLGLANYEASRIPWIFFHLPYFAQKLHDIPHDRKEGFRLMREAEKDNRGFFSDDIRFILFKLEDGPKNKGLYPSGERELFLRRLCVKYPDNELIRGYCAEFIR